MSSSIKDVVIDTNVIRLYDAPGDPKLKALFVWLSEHGALAVSQKLLKEYDGIGNRLLAPLINRLIAQQRFLRISNSELRAFTEDRHRIYTCNPKDQWHARLVFLSIRKLLVSHDNKLVNDVNNFKKVSGIKPRATKFPEPSFYS